MPDTNNPFDRLIRKAYVGKESPSGHRLIIDREDRNMPFKEFEGTIFSASPFSAPQASCGIVYDPNKNKPEYKYNPKRIIVNGPATIVFWKDGTKTIVKCSKEEPYNLYNAFCAALAKKILGNNSRVNKIIKKAKEENK